MPMTRKPFKIHGLSNALQKVPENERATLAAEIEASLSDFDPEHAPGEPVLVVPAGTRVCPTCKGDLFELGVIPSPAGETVCILECETCDATFCEALSSLAQHH
jgi:hypothetical protein